MPGPLGMAGCPLKAGREGQRRRPRSQRITAVEAAQGRVREASAAAEQSYEAPPTAACRSPSACAIPKSSLFN